MQVDTADPPFPRPVGSWWYGCGKSNTMKTGSANDYNEGTDGDFGEFDDKNDESAARESGVAVGSDDQDNSDTDSNSRRNWWKRAWNWTKNIFG